MADWLASIPLWWGKVVAVVAFVGIAVWAWFQPRRFVLKGAPDNRNWRDLRVWASILMAIQIVIYLSF